MSCSPAHSPHSPPLGLTRRWPSTTCRPMATLAVSLVLLAVVGFLGSFPVHRGHPMDSFSSWGRHAGREGELGASGSAAVPVCDKTLLYTFSGGAGFGSEYGVFYRAALYAEDHGYALLIDSIPNWTYLNILEYLQPKKLNCLPPPDWRTIERVKVGKDGWLSAPHLRSDRANGLWDLNHNMRNRYKPLKGPVREGAALSDPHAEPTAILPAEMTLMPAYEQVFVRLSAVVKGVWRPTEIIADQVEGLVARHRVRERITIGVHIRMGDKGAELNNAMKSEGGGSLFRQGNLTAYLEAAQDMLPLLQASSSRSKSALKPLLLVMSDSSNVAAEMERIGTGDFEVAQLPAPSTSQEKGHDERHFNALPWQDRVQAGEGFVRDVTIVGQETDGFIGTASSNVGRLVALLAGPEKVMHHKFARTLDTPLHWSVGWEDWSR